ncbi:MAG: hypothetical protein JWN78_2240 [Bacteroidota bacterium]|nr:hypothetical protein [Bacteroidota bacterium]
MNTLFPRMHVSLYVSNIQKTIEFYTNFFGQEPIKVKPNYAKYVLEKPSLIISFVENKERVKANFGHLGFQVETQEELENKLSEAKLKNLLIKEEMDTNCCYAKQDKFWVKDPDNFQWEVYFFHEDVAFNDPYYENKDATGCCSVSSENVKSDCGCNANVSSSTEKAAACC